MPIDLLHGDRWAAQRRVAAKLDEATKEAEAHGLEHVIGVLTWANRKVQAAVAQADAETRARAVGDPTCPSGYRSLSKDG